jgi:hypothetical protein
LSFGLDPTNVRSHGVAVNAKSASDLGTTACVGEFGADLFGAFSTLLEPGLPCDLSDTSEVFESPGLQSVALGVDLEFEPTRIGLDLDGQVVDGVDPVLEEKVGEPALQGLEFLGRVHSVPQMARRGRGAEFLREVDTLAKSRGPVS